MKQAVTILMLMLFNLCGYAEMRTWTVASGEKIKAEYVGVVFDNVIVRSESGKQLKIPLAKLSSPDKRFVELANPPKISVDFLESFNERFPKPSPLWADASPVRVFEYSFGARIKQKSLGVYDYDLSVEIYAISQERYDPNKYHLIARIKSPPFRLSKANKRRFEFHDKSKVKIIKFLLEGAKYLRGEKFAESLVLVRDERGKIVAYNSTKKWLYNNLNKLMALPVGAWFNDSCTRVHPTSPTDVLTLWGEDTR